MMIRKRVLFLIPHLGGGGAERVVAQLAGGLSTSRYEVHLGLILERAVPANSLPPSVTVHVLRAGRMRESAASLLRMIRQLKPDLIFSGIFHLNFLVLMLRPLLPRTTRYIVRQDGLLLRAAHVGRRTRWMYRILYPRAEAVVCQSETMAREFRGLLGDAGKLHVLPNPVEIVQSISGSGSLWNGAGPNLLAVGRLTHSKGFDLLLPAFAYVLRQFPTSNLTILGIGSEEAALKAQADALGITLRVRFAGYVEQPQGWFRDATAFVLASRYEAMSNAMLEAAAAGLPIITTPAVGGVEHLLSDKRGAWVAKEVSAEALGKSLCTALGSLQPGERVTHEWIAPHRAENALAAYERLFEEVLAEATA